MTPDELADTFPGDGEVSRLMRAHDWAATALGAPEHWPQALKVPLRMMLTSRFEMWLGWGPQIAFLYNDAYIPTLAAKHPAALGRPTREVWSEIYADVEGRIRSVMEDGVATWDRGLLLVLERNGYREETYHSFSYSPLLGDGGAVEGLMCAVVEETERVIGERRLDTLRALAHGLVGVRSREAVLAAVDAALAANRRDFPFALAYLRDNAGAWTGHASTADAEPLLARKWPLDAMDAGVTDIAVPLDAAAGTVPLGAWTVPASLAALVPIGRSGAEQPIGALVLGLNPLLPDDPGIVELAHLLAGQVALALANVEALEAAAGRAERLWLRSRDLSLVLAPDGTFRSVSPSWTTLLGHAVADVVGRTLADFVHGPDVLMMADALRRAGHGDDLTGYEVRMLDVAGDVRWISLNTTLDDGSIFAYGRDVTATKAQTDALLAAEDALRQSQKMEAIGQLTGGVAHDFNNLLTVIRSATDLLMRPNLTDEKRARYIDAISDTTDRATKLTGQLLAFARRQALKPEVFDVGRAVTALSEMTGTLTGSRIRVTIAAPEDPVFVNADPSQFDTAIINMAVNARDAMNGEGDLTISVGRSATVPAIRAHPAIRGDFVTVTIADTGIGIAEETIEQIFEPFYTTKGVGQGTGLGLSQVFGFAKQSGGEVQVDSRAGYGTTFTLYLARVEPDGQLPGAIGDLAPLAADHGTCVLVVEDNADVGTFATQALTELGYRTVYAPDAAHALAELDRDAARFDIVFSDVVMPGMSGIELAHEIRRRHNDLPVLLTSGYSHVLAQNGTYRFELLHKPYSVEQLSRTLRKALGWQRRQQAPGDDR